MLNQAFISNLRRLHRWFAVLLFIFIGFLGITGAILQGIIVAVGEIKVDGGGLPAYITPFHNYAYMLHSGGIFGYKGNFYSIFCGLGLLYFSISGFLMYYNIYRGRRALGRTDPFWPSNAGPEKLWRTMHRWLALVVGVFMVLIGFTATSLDWDYIRFSTWAGGPPTAHQTKGGPGGEWHEFNTFLHRLDFLGWAGHVLGVFLGLCLTFFAISGIIMYLRMRGARSKRGKHAYFW